MTHDLLTKSPGIALFSRQQQVEHVEDAERTWSSLDQALLRSRECCTRVRPGHSGHEEQGWGTLGCLPLCMPGKQARWLRGNAAVPGGCVTGRDLIAVICARFTCINPFPQAPPMSPGLRDTITLHRNSGVQARQQHC